MTAPLKVDEMTDQLLDLVVTARNEHADGVVVLDLVAPTGTALPKYEAGAHVDVHVGPELVRQYSLCGDPADTARYRLGILLDPKSRGGSANIHKAFGVGERVRIGMPRNHFPLHARATHSVLIGGGIGITPILSMAYQLACAGKSFELHYCTRDKNKAAFRDELERSPFRDRIHLHLSGEPDGRRIDLATDVAAPAEGVHVYVCGPAGFMDAVIADARRLGYADDAVHKEHFNAEVDTSGDAFEVVLTQSDKTISVPTGVSIVKALALAGIKVDVSCENGVCGTCLCNVLDGVPDHRDSYLTDDEKAANDQMLICCSRAKTPQLVLDL